MVPSLFRRTIPVLRNLSREQHTKLTQTAKDHGLTFTPHQLVAHLHGLVKGETTGNPAEWAPESVNAVEWLFSLLDTVGGKCTGPECTRLLKILSILSSILSGATKEAAMKTLTDRLRNDRIWKQLNAKAAIIACASMARCRKRDFELCSRMVNTVVEEVGNDLSKISHPRLADLLYSATRHTYVNETLTDNVIEQLYSKDQCDELTAPTMTTILVSCRALQTKKLRLISSKYADVLKRSVKLQNDITEWEARCIGGVFSKVNLLQDEELESIINKGLTRERQFLSSELSHNAYGLAGEVLLEKSGPVEGSAARLLCRQLRLRAFDKKNNKMNIPVSTGMIAKLVSEDILSKLNGEDMYFVMNALTQIKCSDHVVLSRVAARVMSEEIRLKLKWGQHICGIMSSTAQLFKTPQQIHRGLYVCKTMSQLLLSSDVTHTRPAYHLCGAMWSMATLRSSELDVRDVVNKLLPKVKEEELTTRILYALLWSSARVSLLRHQGIENAALHLIPKVNDLTMGMLCLTIWSVAKLCISGPLFQKLIDRSLEIDAPEFASASSVSMMLFAVQISAFRCDAFLDRLCKRVTTDTDLAEELFENHKNRPQELLRVFMSMRYHNTDYLRWLRETFSQMHTKSRAISRERRNQKRQQLNKTFNTHRDKGVTNLQSGGQPECEPPPDLDLEIKPIQV